MRFRGQVGTLLCLGALVTVLALAGCSGASPTDDLDQVREAVDPAAEPEVVETPAPEPNVVTAPDPCTVLPVTAIAEAAGVGAYPAPTPVPEPMYTTGQGATGEFRNVSYCTLSFSDEARSALGIDTGGGEAMDLMIKVAAYEASSYASANNPWSDADPDTLLNTYFAANSEQIGTNAVAQWVNDRMIQDGSTIVAVVDDRYWMELAFFMCHFDDCGPAAVSLAQALVGPLAAAP